MDEEMKSLSLLFFGDFSPTRRFESLVLEKGSLIFGDIHDEIRDADIAFLNLETPLCNSGQPLKKVGSNLRSDPRCINAISDAGFDVVSLANNHIMDYGGEGLGETLELCQRNKLSVCGAGDNLVEAQKPVILERQGVKIAIIAVAEHEFSIADYAKPGVGPLDVIDNSKQLREVKSRADLVFISIHGGNEFFEYPRPGLEKICRYFIDIGADGVICHHSRVAGAYEFYCGKPITYGLGNLLFDHPNPPDGWCESYGLCLNYCTNSKKLMGYKIIPFVQSAALGGVVRLCGEKENVFLKKLEKSNSTLLDDIAYIDQREAFCKKKSLDVILNQYSTVLFRGIGWLGRRFSIHNYFLPKSCLNTKINMLRCESHHELLLSILNKKNENNECSGIIY